MLTAQQILKEIEPLGSESYKRTLLNHGCVEPLFGVKIEYLKKYQKQVKKDYQLSKDLFDTGVYDAQYLAGLIADETKMTPEDLEHWLATAKSPAAQDYAVAWVAAESKHGRELGLKWIESKDEGVATAGWFTLSGYVCVRPDSELDLDELRALLKRVKDTIHEQPNRVRYPMNSFVISVGASVAPLADEALKVAEEIGKVSMKLVGDCKLPSAPDYIQKAWARGGKGKKRKTVRC